MKRETAQFILQRMSKYLDNVQIGVRRKSVAPMRRIMELKNL